MGGITKVCTKCNHELPLAEFHKDKHGKHGYVSQCKQCRKGYSAARYQQVKKTSGFQRIREHTNIAARKRRLILRDEVLAAYGGKCACCDESHHEFLAIDHTNGGGSLHRRAIGRSSDTLYRWLKQHGYPQEGFRLLCHNCNQAIGIYGYCPHEKEYISQRILLR